MRFLWKNANERGVKIVKELEGPRGGRAWLSGHPPSPRLRGRAEEWCQLNAYYNISVYIDKRYSYLPERQGDTESGDGAAASGVQTKRRDQKRETTHREPPMVTRSSRRAMTKSGVPSALTRRVRTW